jgi:glucose/arabinose dehydrogenase
VLRIDVNGTSPGKPYRIPPTNPYVGRAGLDEIWSRGLRNPWRWSIDEATGNLWIGDVGQQRYEEINRSIKPTSGAPGRGVNYGWRQMEGRHCYVSGCSSAGKVRPIVEYSHGSSHCSVTGGHVYRGPETTLQGRYFFADYCSGYIWSIAANAASPATPTRHYKSNRNISSFGEDELGNLYVVDLNGTVLQVTTSP